MKHTKMFFNFMLAPPGLISRVGLLPVFLKKSTGNCQVIQSCMLYLQFLMIYAKGVPSTLNSYIGLLRGVVHLTGRPIGMVKHHIWNILWITFSHPEHILPYPFQKLKIEINQIKNGHSSISILDLLRSQHSLWTKRCKGYPEQ